MAAKKTKVIKDMSGTQQTPTTTLSGISLAQEERLVLLIEEASEVIKEATKTLRFGFESKNPLLEGARTNRENLESEIGNFNNAVRMMVAAEDIRASHIKIAEDLKREMISYWVGKQPESIL